MNIIIVDDEVQTVRAIKQCINWEKLKIDEVFTAYNISHAKEILAEKIIDIAICDIEMPQGNGLELLQWMKDNSPGTESILLTCHAEFEFAKKAVELGSIDYLVKPIPFESLEQVLYKAVSKINASKRLKQFSQFGEYWVINQAIIEEGFWADLLRGNISESPSVIAQNAKKRNVAYKIDEQYLLILISKKRLVTNLESWDDSLLEYALKNIASEVIVGDLNANVVIGMDGHQAVILPEPKDKKQYNERIKDACKEYIISCNKYLGCSVSCYVGRFVFGEQLTHIYNRLLDIDKNNVALTSKIFDLNDWQCDVNSEFSISQTMINNWVEMLQKGEKKNLELALTRFINNMAVEERLTIDVLSIFQQDILQMVYSFLEQKEVQAHQLFKDAKSQEMYRKSTSSIDNMISWMNFFIDKAIDFTEEVTKAQSVISKVKEYIKDNLQTDITRDDIANYVFLNADYLSRIFKKSTGLSLTEYLTDQRIKRSTNLIISTDIPISEIAIEVGYDNFTYFSKTFKKVTGITPSEYRKKNKRSENL
jgi:Response regulator containing CheY-like receiver domain and AraC-type DNA-binding domain